jgi:hypothetical protein
MTETVINTMGLAEHAVSECTQHLRWVGKKSSPHEFPRLQQAWILTRYDAGVVVEQKTEWRDVPLCFED